MAAARCSARGGAPGSSRTAGLRIPRLSKQFSAGFGMLQEDSGNLAGDVKQARGDVSHTAGDLAQEKSDAAQGGGENCANASTTVYNDAATTIYNDEQTALYNDVNTVARDVAAVLKDVQDVQDVQADARALQQLSSPVPTDPLQRRSPGHPGGELRDHDDERRDRPGSGDCLAGVLDRGRHGHGIMLLDLHTR